MRITKLWIKEYKNLRDFHWELNPESPIAVIVGKNASGKSNLLEALIYIFASIKETESNNFDFEIEYNIETPNPSNIKLTRKNKKLQFFRNGKEVEQQKESIFLLPQKIFVYYSGTSNRLQEVIEQSKINRVEYYYSVKYKFVLFALLSSQLTYIKEAFLKNTLGIEGLESFNLEIQKPYKQQKLGDQKPSRENFWNAPAHLIPLFQAFQELSSKDRKVKVFKTEKLQLSFPKEAIEKLFDLTFISFEKDLFELLINALDYGYIRNIEISLKKVDLDTPIKFADLSEGEKQRLAIRGIIELYQGNEMLFLFDEPDTFAHPRWQWEFIPDLESTMTEFSQVIYITHSPIVLSTVQKNGFFMEQGIINPISAETYAMDVDDVLLNAMDTSKSLQKAKEDFEEYIDIIEKGEGETEKGNSLRIKLEEKYPLNHPLFAKADMLLAFNS